MADLSKYANPAASFRIGDVVRIGDGRVDWTITAKGRTSALTVASAAGAKRQTHTHDVTLVRRVDAEVLRG